MPERTTATGERRGWLHRLLRIDPIDPDALARVGAAFSYRRDPAVPTPYARPAVMGKGANPYLTSLVEVVGSPEVILTGTRNRQARKLATAHACALPIEVRALSRGALERFCARVEALDLDVIFLPMYSVSGFEGGASNSQVAYQLATLNDFRTSTRSTPGQWQPRAVVMDEAVISMGHTLTGRLQDLVQSAGAPETFRVHESLYEFLDELRASYARRHKQTAPF